MHSTLLLIIARRANYLLPREARKDITYYSPKGGLLITSRSETNFRHFLWWDEMEIVLISSLNGRFSPLLVCFIKNHATQSLFVVRVQKRD